MKKFDVKHLVLCEVSVWRTIQAKNYQEALEKVAAIETITATYKDGADLEIISDREVKLITITEVTE